MPGRTVTDLFVNVALCLLVYSCCSKAQQQGDIRLVNGNHAAEGRVEIYNSGEWGTVCDDQFGLLDATVVCRQLGFESAERAVPRAGYGQGTVPKIWMDGVACRGTEQKLSDCRFNSWGINDCRHSEDVGVICKQAAETPGVDPGTDKDPLQVRLSCPPSPSNTIGDCTACYEKEGCGSKVPNAGVKGIVEVLIGDQWVPVSGKKWTIQAANTVCGQLGYPVTFPSPPLNVIWPKRSRYSCFQGSQQCSPAGIYRRGLRTTVFDNRLLCTGLEHNIGSCYYTSTDTSSGPIENVATVHCGYSSDRENSEHCYEDFTQNEIYRLRAGALPHIGRVEVKREGKWATICDQGWDLRDASVVCRNLGYGSAKRVFTRSELGRGIGATVLPNLECKGNERLLSDCARTVDQRSLSTVLESYCPSHTGDVGVECNVPQCPRTPSSRIRDGVIEINGPLGWGKVCDGTIDIDGAAAVCREDRGLFAKSIESISDNSGGIFYKGEIDCKGAETRLAECTIATQSVSSCSGGVVNVICTSELPDLVPNLEQFERSLRSYPYTDRIPLYYLQCAREENCLSSSADNQANNAIRNLLRFDSLTMNYGTTDFTPALDRSKWIWHSCHNHYHSYENFITYDILNKAGVEVAEGHKASFCLEDSFCAPGGYQRYRCATGNQGISKNCGDLYGRNLDCQWIDITDNGGGSYLLRQTVNAEKLTPETDYRNNEIECEIIISSRSIVTGTCKHSDH